MLNNISFTSLIKPVNQKEYLEVLKGYPSNCASVYPWTVNQGVYSERVYTRGIYDCSGLLITDGVKALLLHLCPDMETNKNFATIERYLNNNISLMQKSLQAFLTGSNSNKGSYDLFNNLKKYLIKHKIPTSELQDAGQFEVSFAYRSDNDTIHICLENAEHFVTEGLSDSAILKKYFKNVSIAECDEVGT